jgi:uncharacterized membrane protein
MILMLAGLALFLASHGFTTMREQRAALIARIGDGPYKVVYSIVSVIAVLMIGYGYGDWRADGSPNLWDPPGWTRHLAILLMLLASIMLVAAYSNGRIKAALKHPMLVSVKTWALAHLLTNGDLATIVLVLGILAWAVYARISLKRRAPGEPLGPKGLPGDALAVGGGILLFLFLAYVFHPYVIGAPVMRG